MNVSGSPFFKKTESPKWDFKTSRGDGPLLLCFRLPPSLKLWRTGRPSFPNGGGQDAAVG